MPLGEGFKIADAYVDIHMDINDERIREAVANLPEEMNKDTQRSGERMGDDVSKGMHESLTDNERIRTAVQHLPEDVKKDTHKSGFDMATAMSRGMYDELANQDDVRTAVFHMPDNVHDAARAAGHDMGDSVATGMHDSISNGDRVRTAIQHLPEDIKADSDRAGESIGKDVSTGMGRSMQGRGALIAAAVAGGLAFGAPVIAGGVGLMFAGLAGLLARQDADIRLRFQQTWAKIQTQAEGAAASTLSYFHVAIQQVGDSFTALLPQIRAVFQAVGPLILPVVDGIMNLARNAMPGLIAMLQNAQPVFTGFKSLLGSVGTGLSDMFATLSHFSGSGQQVFVSLGGIVKDLLSVLGTLMGAGVRLSSVILPPVAAILDVVTAALKHMVPELEAVAAGWLAFKGVNIATNLLGKLSTALTGVAEKDMPGVSTAAGKVASGVDHAKNAMSALGGAIPILGAVFAVAGDQMAKAASQEDVWAQNLIDGGTKAISVRKEYLAQFGGKEPDWLGKIAEWAGFASSMDDARKKAHDLWAEMSPLEQAQQQVQTKTNELDTAVARYGATAPQATAASDDLKAAQERLRSKQDELQRATDGVTKSMIDQATQALASVDSEVGYNVAIDDLKKKQDALNKAIKANGPASEEATVASNDLDKQILQTAAAAGKMAADALPANTSELKKNKAEQGATLAELERLSAEMGANFPAAGQRAIDRLKAAGATVNDAGVAASGTTADFSRLGLTIQGVPNSKSILVSSTTPAVDAQLSALGFHVTHMPNGTVRLDAQTATAEQALNWAARNRTSTIFTNIVQSIKSILPFGNAAGGPIGRADGGQVSGPGGPTDDMVPATGPGGSRYALSDDEWIIRAAAAKKYGPKAMAAINDGRAVVGYAGGGQVATSGRSGVTVQTLNFNVQGVWDFASATARRQLGENLRGLIREVERSYA